MSKIAKETSTAPPSNETSVHEEIEVPLSVIQPNEDLQKSNHKIPEDQSVIDLSQEPPQISKSSSKLRRPGHGIITFLFLLLTGAGIALFAVKETRKSSIVIYLPIFVTCLLGYILFLCCVNNEGEEDDYNPEPVALRQYLETQESQKKASKRSKRSKISQDPESLKQMADDKFVDHQVMTMSISESFDVDDVDRARYHEHAHNVFTPPHVAMGGFFQENFPGISKSLEGIEAQFHGAASKFRHKVLPPHQCVACQTGVYIVDDRDALSTVCHHKDCSHQHENRPKFQNPDIDCENYMDVPGFEKDVIFGDSSVEEDTDLSFDTSLRTREELNDTDMSGLDDTLTTNTKTTATTSTSSILNLTGKYKLVHNHNFDAFLKTQNISMLLRKAADKARPIHIYTHDIEKGTFRVQIEGIVKGDTTFTLDGPPSDSNIRHIKFKDHVTYVENGQAIQVRKVAQNAAKDQAQILIVKRTLANNGHNMVLSSKAIFEDGRESLESVQTFHRIQ